MPNYPALANTVVLVIRHAEKPDNGVHLSSDGFARAAAYATYFTAYHIDYIFSSEQSAGSNRPFETVTPLANRLKLPINDQFKNKKADELAEYLLSGNFAAKTILICWHHGEIPDLLTALGCDPNALLPPQGKWPKTAFGLMVKILYDNQGAVNATIVNEHLMHDDENQVIR